MRTAFLIPLLGVAIATAGCANRLPTTTPDENVSAVPAPAPSYRDYVVVRTTTRPVVRASTERPRVYPAPPPPASVVLRRPTRPAPVVRRVRVVPAGTPRRVQPAVVAPSACAPAKSKARPAPAPCVPTCGSPSIFTTNPDCTFDPCDPCAGGRCAVPR